MSLPGLFLREARQQDNSLTQLPQDMDLWAENIVSLIREKLPQSKSCTIKITFIKKNEELGTSTGSAELFNQKLNRTIYVPLIVKNYSLCPLDVMMIANPNVDTKFDTVPLTPDYFKDALFDGDVFDKLDQPFDRLQQLYGHNQGALTMPPTFRNVHASANIIDSIKDTMWQEDVDSVIKDLKSNESYLVGYEKRANLDILRKIVQPTKKSKDSQPTLKNITLLKKDMGHNYQVYSTSDEAYDPIVNDMSTREVRDMLERSGNDVEDTLHEVERNGEHLIFNDLHPKPSVVHHPGKSQYLATDFSPVEAKTFGPYKVQDKNGTYHTGLVISNVISYGMKPIPYKLFVNDQRSAISNTIIGHPMEGKLLKLNFKEPLVGMTGTFVATNDKNAIATFPLTIKSLMDKGGSIHILGVDLNGKKVKLKFAAWGCGEGLYSTDQELKSEFTTKVTLKRIVKVKDFYIIPSSFKFLPMDNFTSLSENKDSIMRKAASARLDSNPIKVAHTGASQFALKGPDIIKMASQVGWNANNLSAAQTIFLTSGKRCQLQKVAEAIKIAGKFGESSIHGLPAIVFGEQVREENIKLASQYAAVIRKLRVNLVKEASHFEDSQMVDTALSLNFINPDNLDKFTGFIPAFEGSIKMLAQTLLASRLGMTEIPEQSSATAMMKLVDVVRGLKRLAIHNSGDRS